MIRNKSINTISAHNKTQTLNDDCDDRPTHCPGGLVEINLNVMGSTIYLLCKLGICVHSWISVNDLKLYER